jgi:amino acid transporter
MSTAESPPPAGAATPGGAGPDASGRGTLPIFSRKSTGLVRQISLLDITIFNFGASIPFGFGFGAFISILFIFPRANPYVAITLCVIPCVIMSLCFAYMTALIPRIGGDYAITSRILPPWLAFGGNVCIYIACVLGIPFIAYLASTLGASAILATIGTVAHSHTISTWSTYFTPAHRVGIFILSVILALIVTLLAASGTKVILRAYKYCVLAGLVGLVVDLGILLFTSHSSFVHTVNSLAGHGAYGKVVASQTKLGLYPTHVGYSTKSTIGGIYYGLAVLGTLWWSTYLAAEFRGAGQRKRQLVSMITPVLVYAALVVILLKIMTATVGYNFFTAALNGGFAQSGGAVAGAGYVYFGGIISGSTALATILGLLFMLWFIPGIYENMAQNHRGLLAWSFDGLLPRSLSKVSDRTHAPTRTIWLTFILSLPLMVWASFSSNFFTIFGYALLFVFPPVILVGISAIVVKWVRPELYKGSVADVKVGPVPILPIIGTLCVLVGVGAISLAVYFAKALAVNAWTVALAPVGVIVVAAIWWHVAKAVRAREGIDLSMAYKIIPPE